MVLDCSPEFCLNAYSSYNYLLETCQDPGDPCGGALFSPRAIYLSKIKRGPPNDDTFQILRLYA